MKRAGIALSLVLAVALPLCGQSNGPTIVFDNQVKDFGKMSEGQPIKHVFKFTNKGNGTLEILSAEPTCGCTSMLLSAKQIPPGGTGEIETAVKTEGLQGHFEKSVVVKTNDPRQPEMTLFLRGTIEPEFTLSERMIYFGSVPRGKEVVKEITVSLPAERNVKLLSATSTDAQVTVKIEPVAGTKNVRVIAVQKADAPEGYHFGNLLIKTTSTNVPELQIPVRGMITKATSN